MDEETIRELKATLPEWNIIDIEGIKRLERKFLFKDFEQALAFTNMVGDMAETEDHHPSLLTEWGAVTVTWWTHSVKGLHRNDFIMAARSDELFNSNYPK